MLRSISNFLLFGSILWSALPCVAVAQYLEYSDNPSGNCSESSMAEAKYAPLRSGFRSKDSPFVRYANSKKPDQVEHDLIAQFMDDIDRCRNRSDAKRWRDSNGDAVTNAIMDSMYSVFVSLAVKLYNRDITYGEFHRAMDAEIATHNQRISARNDELDRDYNQQTAQAAQADAQARAAQRARNASIMQQAVQGVQKSLQPPPSVRTNCSVVGDNIYCRSQ